MKRKYLYLFIFSTIITTSLLTTKVQAQGCVAVRNMSSCSLFGDSVTTKWQVSLNYRYFKSYKHYRGREEEEQRVKDGTEVINHDNSVLVGVGYTINKTWSIAATVPLLFMDRSSLYEHYGNSPTTNPRFHTQARGLGDIRLSVYRSMVSSHKLNLTMGVGVKLPTGNYNTKDFFHKRNSQGNDSLVYKVVDQSIQLGDGGFGVSAEFDANYKLNSIVDIYGSGFYLVNPRNTNGIKRSSSLTAGIPLSDEFSVADQYLLRAGARVKKGIFQLSVGGRYEGVAARDLIGKSDGWRRPGYIVSIEPALAVETGIGTFLVNCPIAVERNRVQNTIDIARSKQEGKTIIGDAAFADWLLSVTYVKRF